MLTRKEYVDYCSVCTKRKFDMKKGQICSLTNEYPEFDSECQERDIDENLLEKQVRFKEQKEKDLIEAKTFGLSKFGIKNQFASGVIVAGGGLTWLIVGLSQDIIFFYPIILIVIGIVLIIKSISDKIRKSAQELKNKEKDQILDADLDE